VVALDRTPQMRPFKSAKGFIIRSGEVKSTQRYLRSFHARHMRLTK
jgi:hypothetical protein